MRSHQNTAAKWKGELAGDSFLTERMMTYDQPYADEQLRTYQEINDQGGFTGSSRSIAY